MNHDELTKREGRKLCDHIDTLLRVNAVANKLLLEAEEARRWWTDKLADHVATIEDAARLRKALEDAKPHLEWCERRLLDYEGAQYEYRSQALKALNIIAAALSPQEAQA